MSTTCSKSISITVDPACNYFDPWTWSFVNTPGSGTILDNSASLAHVHHNIAGNGVHVDATTDAYVYPGPDSFNATLTITINASDLVNTLASISVWGPGVSTTLIFDSPELPANGTYQFPLFFDFGTFGAQPFGMSVDSQTIGAGTLEVTADLTCA